MLNNQEQKKSWFYYYEKIKDDILIEDRKNENEYLDNVKELVRKFLEMGDRNKNNGISSSQLRNVFSRVKKSKTPKQLYLLRPKLAYIHGRPNTKRGMQKLIDILDEQIKNVNDEEKLEQFQNFFESVIAYHKYLGGKD